MEYKVPFNKPYLTGKEGHYIYQAVLSGKISGDGIFTRRCHQYFEHRYGFRKCLLTTSCTDALEMAALLIELQPGDEIVMPSYTFVSTANAFVLRGAKIRFVDSRPDHPGIDEDKIEELITTRTKAIVVVHYAGVACDMAKVMSIANRHKLYVIEDAAQAIDSFFVDVDGLEKPLGSIGHLATFSFHETKNIVSGEGGMLVINDESFVRRAEIIRDKGTNRSAFFRGEIDKYGWVDIGSSFLPSDIIAAFLFAQLENLDNIQFKRHLIWNQYYEQLKPMAKEGKFRLPTIPSYATNNVHMFYIICRNLNERDGLIAALKGKKILSVFHYLSLHKSSFYASLHDNRELPYCDDYSDCLLRLPFYYELEENAISLVTNTISDFFTEVSVSASEIDAI